MKRRILKFVCAAAAAAIMVTGCSSSSGKVKIGELSITEGEAASQSDYIRADKTAYESVAFQSVTEQLLALENQKVDALCVPSIVALYMTRGREDLDSVTHNYGLSYQMALLPESKALRDDLSNAIGQLGGEGTLDKLFTDYIKAVINGGGDPTNTELNKIEGAKTIKVAITGDLPPLDYVTADGKPAGFNVAVMNAISAKLGINIEFVTVAADARTAALSSGKADVVFWYESGGLSGAADTSELIFTTSYFNSLKSIVAKSDKLDSVLTSMTMTEQEKSEETEDKRSTAYLSQNLLFI